MSGLNDFIQEFKDRINDIDNIEPSYYTKWFSGDFTSSTTLCFLFSNGYKWWYTIDISMSHLTENGTDQILIRTNTNMGTETLCLQQMFDYTLFHMVFKDISAVEQYIREKMLVAIAEKLDINIDEWYMDQCGYVYGRELLP